MRLALLLACTLVSCGTISSKSDDANVTHGSVRTDVESVRATDTSDPRTSSSSVANETSTSSVTTSPSSDASGHGLAASTSTSHATRGDEHTSSTTASSNGKTTVSEPTNPVERLIAGNARFVAGASLHLRDDPARRTAVAAGQKPFAVIVACADSRVAPELLFDQGLGDLFVVRCAGNVVDDLALGSIEYAVEHLGAATIVVVGHERCGAVTAALEGGHLPGHIAKLVEAIRPNLGDLPERGKAAVDEGVRANAAAVAEQLEACEPILSEFAHAGKLRILAARYDLDTGAVEFLTPTRP